MNRGRPLVISASRRTDLPGFYASECAKRIRLRISRLRTRPLAGVVFWTKHVDPFLPGGALNSLVASELENPVVNLTITGLGSTPLEPGTPPFEHSLSHLSGLIEVFKGEPFRIRWRFEPLIKGHTSLKVFKTIAEEMAAKGVFNCTFSFPSYWSLKGDLKPQFEKAGIPAWQRSEKRDFLFKMSEIAEEFGISLLSCSQPDNAELADFVGEAQCIPFAVLARSFSPEELGKLAKDRSQRTHCRCIESEDIGSYEKDRCPGGCVYCYSKASL